MKRFAASLLLLMILAVSAACAGGGENASQQSSDSQTGSSIPETQDPPLDDPLTDPAVDGFRQEVGEAAFASICQRVGFTPDAFVSHPDGRVLFYEKEFEVPTILWLYQPDAEEPLTELLSSQDLPKNMAIKLVEWPGEESGEVFLILGNQYGTVSPGGNVYRLDLTSRVYHPFYETGRDEVQVVGLAVQGDQLLLDLVTYDQEMMDPTTSQVTVPLYPVSQGVGRFTQETPPQGSVALAMDPSGLDASASFSAQLKLDDSGEGVVIVPRYQGSTVRVYSVKEVNGDFVNVGWLGAYYNTPDGWSLDLRTLLPEVMPQVKVVVSCFDQTGEFLVGYDGRGESPARWF